MAFIVLAAGIAALAIHEHQESQESSTQARQAEIGDRITKLHAKRQSEKAQAALSYSTLSETCRALNRRITSQMNSLYLKGTPPPFSTAPLVAVLRSGECGQGNPQVRVLDKWMEASQPRL